MLFRSQMQNANKNNQPQLAEIISQQIQNLGKQLQQQTESKSNSNGSSSSDAAVDNQGNKGNVQFWLPPFSNETQTTQPPFMPPPFMPVAVTVLYKQANPGDNTLNLPTPDGAQIGMDVIIGTGSNAEKRTIVGFGSLILDRPLDNAHPVSTPVFLYIAGGAPPISTFSGAIANTPSTVYSYTTPVYTNPAYTTTPVYRTTPAYTTTPVYTTTPAYRTTPVYTTRSEEHTSELQSH